MTWIAANNNNNSDLFGGVSDFFDSTAWHLIRNLGLFFLFVLWLATVFWVYKDARRRIADSWLVGMAVLLPIAVPFLGPIIYLFFRPPEYLEDVRERELEIKAMEERLDRRDLRCPVCRADVAPEFLICPVCTTKLKQACVNCKAPLEALWQVCPFCETPVDAPTAIHMAESWESGALPAHASAGRRPATRRRKRPSP